MNCVDGGGGGADGGGSNGDGGNGGQQRQGQSQDQGHGHGQSQRRRASFTGPEMRHFSGTRRAILRMLGESVPAGSVVFPC